VFILLEFIFQGFFEWIYSLILEIWNYFSSCLLNVMSLDFAYIQSHIPVVTDISQSLLAVGWALLLGNLVFQALRSMASGLGFEGEDPKLLFARTFVFGFLLLASPQICETVLTVTGRVIALLEIPDAINVHLVDSSVFGVMGAAWLLVIIFDIITMFMVLSLLLEVAERYVVLAVLTITAPLAFAMGGSKSTSAIFAGWCRMFGSMCLLMATNIVFFKMLLSVVSTIPSFPDVFLWMVLIVSIVKVAKKADEIIIRIGLNPAITGNRSTLPGMLAYTVFRTALSVVTKGAADGIGGALGLAGKGVPNAGRAAGGTFKNTGKGFGSAAGGAVSSARPTAGTKDGGQRFRSSLNQPQQTNSQQEHTQQQTATREHTTNSQTAGPGSVFRTEHSSRRTSVQPGTHRAPGYVAPSREQDTSNTSSATNLRSSQQQTASEKRLDQTNSPPKPAFAFGGPHSQSGPAGTTVHGSQRQSATERQPVKAGSAGTTVHNSQRQSATERQSVRTGSLSASAPTSGTPHSQLGLAGTAARSSQRETVTERQSVRSGSPPTSVSTPGAPHSQPGLAGTAARSSQRETVTERQSVRTGSPSASASGAPHSQPGLAGTTARDSQRQTVTERQSVKTGPPPASVFTPGAAHSQPGPAEKTTRSTRRETAFERKSGAAVTPPLVPPRSAAGSSPTRQETRQTAVKDKPPVKDGVPVRRPCPAGTAAGPRTPPAQKLNGNPAVKPVRQTNRKGGKDLV